jgi:hypothetical protein
VSPKDCQILVLGFTVSRGESGDLPGTETQLMGPVLVAGAKPAEMGVRTWPWHCIKYGDGAKWKPALPGLAKRTRPAWGTTRAAECRSHPRGHRGHQTDTNIYSRWTIEADSSLEKREKGRNRVCAQDKLIKTRTPLDSSIKLALQSQTVRQNAF